MICGNKENDMKKYKAILADIDGTLVSKGETIMPLTKKMITLLHERGVSFGLATGRPITDAMFMKKDDWGLSFDFDMLVGMNGGMVWTKQTNKVESFFELDEATLREILEMMAPLGLNASIYEGQGMVSMYMDELTHASMKRNHMKVTISNGDMERLCMHPSSNILYRYNLPDEERILAYIDGHANPKYVAIRTFPGIIEFMDPRMDKGNGLRMYAERAGIDASQIVGFGDMDNDIALLKAAGLGVCMQNGSDGTKAIADEITAYPCWQDGMGRWLESHLDLFI